MGTPIRFPFGVSTNAKTTAFGDCPIPAPLAVLHYFDDFTAYRAGDWTITNVGTTPTQALGSVTNGVLTLTTVASASSSTYLQHIGPCWLPEPGKKFWFQARFRVSAALDTQLVAGVQLTDTTPLDATDGIYFIKPTANSGVVNLICRRDATTGSITLPSVVTLADNTFVALGFYYDGRKTLYAFVNNEPFGQIDLTANPAAFLPDTVLRISFGVGNGGSTARTAEFDYVFAAQER